MKKFSSLKKGFTLVELMIVIAIIGILAAVLYPSMTGYFERSRDTNRQGALRNVALSLHQYRVDNNAYPGTNSTKCLKDIETTLVGSSTTQSYIKSLPKDPQNKIIDWCDGPNAWSFGYKWIKARNADTAVSDGQSIVAANMEIKANATMGKDLYKGTTLSAENTINLIPKEELAKTNLQNVTTKGDWYLTMTQE